MCAGTPRAADQSWARRSSPTCGSASGTGTISAVRGMLGSVKRALLIVNPYSTHVTGRRITEVSRALAEHVEVETQFTQRPGPRDRARGRRVGGRPRRDRRLLRRRDLQRGAERRRRHDAVRVPARAAARACSRGRSACRATRSPPREPSVARSRRTAPRRISLGAVNGRRFSFSAGLGFDGEAVRRLDGLGRDPGGARPGDGGVPAHDRADAARAARALGPAARDRGRRPRGVRARRELRPVLVCRARSRCASRPGPGSRKASTSRRPSRSRARHVPVDPGGDPARQGL